MISGLQLHNSSNIYFLELFLQIELFLSLSVTHKCEPISIFIYYFNVHLVFTLIYANYRELMSWSRAISSLLQAYFLLGFRFLETKICFLTLGKCYFGVQVDFARSYNIQVACSWKHVKKSTCIILGMDSGQPGYRFEQSQIFFITCTK